MISTSSPLDRPALVAWYRRNRARSRALFDLLADEAYYSQPIALRHPIVFYEGHLPAFSFNTLVKRGLGRPSIDAALERLFARGIDPDDLNAERNLQNADVRAGWPTREEVRAFAAEADRQVLDALASGDVERPGHPLLDRAEAVSCILEHEAMHHETLLYMCHRLPFTHNHPPADYAPHVDAPVPSIERIGIPAGRATLGVDRESMPFGSDNELPAYAVDVPAFEIDRHDVTNARFLEFVAAGGYDDPRWWRPEDWRWIESEPIRHPLFWECAGDRWYWRGMFERLPLPPSWPVYVSHAEAAAFARWSGGWLLTEAEL